MAPNYPELPSSPDLSTKSKSKSKKSTSKAASPLSKPNDVVYLVPDFEKYETRRAAIGTGIFSSLFTLSILVFINELKLCFYYHDLLNLNPFKNVLFTIGFLISIFHLVVIGGTLFLPSYLLEGKKAAKLSPLILAILLQLFMLHYRESDVGLKIFSIQGIYAKYLLIRDFLTSYGTFFGTCIIFVCLNSPYNSPTNKIVRPFEYVDYPEEDEKETSPV